MEQQQNTTSHQPSVAANILAGMVLLVIAALGVVGLIGIAKRQKILIQPITPLQVWKELAPGLYEVSVSGGKCFRLKDGDGMTSLSCVKL